MFTKLFNQKYTKELRKWAEVEFKNDAEWAYYQILETGKAPQYGETK